MKEHFLSGKILGEAGEYLSVFFLRKVREQSLGDEQDATPRVPFDFHNPVIIENGRSNHPVPLAFRLVEFLVSLEIAKGCDAWVDWRPVRERAEMMLDIALWGLVKKENNPHPVAQNATRVGQPPSEKEGK